MEDHERLERQFAILEVVLAGVSTAGFFVWTQQHHNDWSAAFPNLVPPKTLSAAKRVEKYFLRRIGERGSTLEEAKTKLLGSSENKDVEDMTRPTKKLRGETKEVAMDSKGDLETPDTRSNSAKKATPLGNKRSFDQAKLAKRTLDFGGSMADVEMSSGDTENLNKEQITKISRYPYAYEGIPKQYTTILPYWKNNVSGQVSATAGQRSTDLYIRMNSIYDIIKSDSVSFSADPTATADAADASVQEVPMWRNYWGQFWEYWTVLECRYKIDIQFTNNRADTQMGVIWGYVGLQKPPKVSSGTTDITWDEYRRWKGYKLGVVHSKRENNGFIVNSAATGSGGGGSGYPSNELVPTSWTANYITGTNNFLGDERSLSITGVYHPGDGTHEVVEDALAERWIYGNNVPKEQNLLWIRTFYMPTSSTGTTLDYTYRIDLEYVVQYKDQKVIWQFPHTGVTSQAISLAPVGT